jgi:hypothetical protein
MPPSAREGRRSFTQHAHLGHLPSLTSRPTRLRPVSVEVRAVVVVLDPVTIARAHWPSSCHEAGLSSRQQPPAFPHQLSDAALRRRSPSSSLRGQHGHQLSHLQPERALERLLACSKCSFFALELAGQWSSCEGTARAEPAERALPDGWLRRPCRRKLGRRGLETGSRSPTAKPRGQAAGAG